MKLPRKAATALASLTLAAVALTGCSGSSSSGAGTTTATGAATGPVSTVDPASLSTDTHADADDGEELPLHGVTVLETKSRGGASLADRQLWAQGLRPTRISKYGTGLSALDRTVPGNRWHPVLRRHFRTTTTSLLSDRMSA